MPIIYYNWKYNKENFETIEVIKLTSLKRFQYLCRHRKSGKKVTKLRGEVPEKMNALKMQNLKKKIGKLIFRLEFHEI